MWKMGRERMWEMGRKKMNRTMMKTKRLKSIDFSGNSFIIQGFGVILLFHSETAGRQLSYGIPWIPQNLFLQYIRLGLFQFCDHFHPTLELKDLVLRSRISSTRF